MEVFEVPGCRVTATDDLGNGLVVSVERRRRSGRCPRCGWPRRAGHRGHRRRSTDLPCLGRSVRLDLEVRRLRCANAACPRRTFAERAPSLVTPRARRTRRPAEAQCRIGLAPSAAARARDDVHERLHRAAADARRARAPVPGRRGSSGSTTGRGGTAGATAPSWSILSGDGPPSSCPTARDRPWLRGCAVPPRSRSWPGAARRRSRAGCDCRCAGRAAGCRPMAFAFQHASGRGPRARPFPWPSATPARARGRPRAEPALVRLHKNGSRDRRWRREPRPRAAPPMRKRAAVT